MQKNPKDERNLYPTSALFVRAKQAFAEGGNVESYQWTKEKEAKLRRSLPKGPWDFPGDDYGHGYEEYVAGKIAAKQAEMAEGQTTVQARRYRDEVKGDARFQQFVVEKKERKLPKIDLTADKIADFLYASLKSQDKDRTKLDERTQAAKDDALRVLFKQTAEDLIHSLKNRHSVGGVESNDSSSQLTAVKLAELAVEVAGQKNAAKFLKEMLLDQTTESDTAHPSNPLDALNMEPLIKNLKKNILALSNKDLSQIANWKEGKKPHIISGISRDTLLEIDRAFKEPSKRTPEEEREIASIWAKDAWQSTASYMHMVHTARRIVAPNVEFVTKENGHWVGPEDKEKLQMKIWQIMKEDGSDHEGWTLSIKAAEEIEKVKKFGFAGDVVAIQIPKEAESTPEELSELRKDNWGVHGGAVTIEELDSLKPGKKRSWVIGDADSKDGTQPWRVEDAINEVRNLTVDLYHADIMEIISDLESNGSQPLAGEAVSDLEKLAKALKNGRINADQLINGKKGLRGIKEIKQHYESKGLVFSRAVVDNKKIAYSKLDVLYTNAKNHGDYVYKVEIRQNAKQNESAFDFVIDYLDSEGVIDKANVTDPNGLLAAIKEMPAEELDSVKQKLAEKYTELYPQAKAYWKWVEEGAQEGKKPHQPSEEELRGVQVLGFFHLMEEYREAMSSYIAAEAGTDWDLEKNPNKGLEEIREAVIERTKFDMQALMVFEKLVLSDEAINSPKKAKLIPLFEDPFSVLFSPEAVQGLMADGFIEHCGVYLAPIKVWDVETAEVRDMTLADRKRIAGREVAEGDDEIILYTNPEVMKAGSDLMARSTKAGVMGISHSNEKVNDGLAEEIVEHEDRKIAILVLHHKGGGGSRQRSNSAPGNESNHVRTDQGATNMAASPHSKASAALETQITIMRNRLAPVSTDFTEEELKPDTPFPTLLQHPGLKDGKNKLLTQSEKEVQGERYLAVVRDRASVIYSPGYKEHLTLQTNKVQAVRLSKAARKATRTGKGKAATEYPAEVEHRGTRAIELTNLTSTGGDNGTETQVYRYFVPTDDGVAGNGLLSEENCAQLLNDYLKDSNTQKLFADTVEGLSESNYGNSWRMASANARILKEGRKEGAIEIGDRDDAVFSIRMEKDQETGELWVINSESGELTTRDELAKALHDDGLATELRKKGFRDGHFVLADHDRQYEGTAKALYELYYRIQHSPNKSGELSPTDENQLLEDLKPANFRSGAEDDFGLPKLYDIMTEEGMHKAISRKADLDKQRVDTAEDHIDRLKSGSLETKESDYMYYRGVTHFLTNEMFPPRQSREALENPNARESVQVPNYSKAVGIT